MEDTKGAINRVIGMINNMPFVFNTEADIQGLVYRELLKEYTKDYPTGLTDSEGERYYTNRVHREYLDGNRGRIDTVVFAEEQIASIDTYWLCIKTSEPPRYRPIRLQDAIEIKTVGGKGEQATFKEIRKDIKGLSKFVKEKKAKEAHFLFIIRPQTKKSGTMKRMGMDKAERDAREMCEKNDVQFYCNDYKKLFVS